MYKILAVLGDYYHHRELLEKSLMSAVLSAIGDRTSTEVRIIEMNDLIGALDERPDAVVLFKENRLDPEGDSQWMWMTEEISEAIQQYVMRGGGWLAWHSGLASYPANGGYVQMLRGHFLSHPTLHQPVDYEGAGIRFTILDEHYFVSCQEDQTEVYLRSSSVDGNSIAAWRHTFGDGRVSCFTPAHLPDGLEHASVIQLLGEALAWCAGVSNSVSKPIAIKEETQL
ncbi:ThuA domain-containing protein [Paenibacillus sp. HWE-109]|uniref:ThuA domain-containing protein n=1 Tax=Paenibacillus sp. HWE-109 TaxID=1306526 RepID=UPI001EDCC6CE|nr:ThuA domain-containing protein [Paenibacillus sp. HWE-109]UKS28271.1 ThuA domain-containing protein [Paenibacillus sp. HWE-109]